MKRKNSILGGIVLCFATLHGADVPPISVVAPDAETGTQIPEDSYYSSANLANLPKGKRKHAPLAIIIDQTDTEGPDQPLVGALTGNFAQMLQTAFVPTIVSSSIAYNYFVRRSHPKSKADLSLTPEKNPVSFDKWQLYHIPSSQFLLFVPEHYIKYYKDSLGLNLKNLLDISPKLPSGQNSDDIIQYIKSYKKTPPLFSIDNLRTILTTIKQAKSSSPESEQAELKQQIQLPIWDIILHGHGSAGESIGGLPPEKIQELLNFFNNELPIGLFYIQTCSAGGENLRLLEFDTTINKKKVLRNLDYILIVGAITDKSTWFVPGGPTNKLFYQLYSNAARLQGKGESLNTLLNDLNSLYRHAGSPHGSSNIPQVWLPGGLGFQTYKINEKVQILGNVKIKKHEDEKSPIVLPASSMAILIYAMSIEVPIVVTSHAIDEESGMKHALEEVSLRDKEWKNIPNIAELIMQNTEKLLPIYKPGERGMAKFKEIYKEFNLLYPEFISMQNADTHYFSEIILQPPLGKETEMTGVMHFIRDAFFDIGNRASTKTFLIEELVGNNDISKLLELSRAKNGIATPNPLEAKLQNSINKQIRLQKVYIDTSRDGAHLGFIFDNTAWSFSFKPGEQAMPYFWHFKEIDTEAHTGFYEKLFGILKLMQKTLGREKIDQKPISEILGQKAEAASVAYACQLRLKELEHEIERLEKQREQKAEDEAEAKKIAKGLGPEWG